MHIRSILMGAAASALVASAASAERGSDGQVNILYWQAVSIMNPYLSNGTKDVEAGSLVLEPLARFNENGDMVPYLAQEIPTLENGGVSEDLTTITWKLKDGVVWSDGTPVTAEDAIFSWQYCTHPEGGCAQSPNYAGVANVVLKGGGDPASAARSVLETGEFDYAWNPQVEPEILAQMLAAGKGELISAFGTLVERILVNQTDPDPALGDERSTTAHPHPFLTDVNVSKALSLAIDREILVETGYGEAGRITCNLVPAPEINASPNNDWCMKQDMAQAAKLLDDAGWVMGSDGVREKDGKRLSVLYQTSTNSVRQAAQALVKQWWNELGVEVELRNIDAAVFFGADPGSPDTLQKFYGDIEMFANNFDGTDPEKYLGDWICAEIPRPETQWQGGNHPRMCSEEYDELHAQLGRVAGAEKRAEIAIKLNDMIVNSGSFIPLAHRGRVSAKSNALGGVIMNPWDSELWNAADWHRVQ